jgi:uncharacterized protein with von Willebrand factor type A (vWA) domain
VIDGLTQLAERLRTAGIDVSTSEVIDGANALACIDIADRDLVRACLRASMVKQADPAGQFDRCFDLAFRAGSPEPPQRTSRTNTDVASADASATATAAGGMDQAVLDALLAGDEAALVALAEQAVRLYGGTDDGTVSERKLMHRVMRAIDLSRMLTAAMQQLRKTGELGDLDLVLQRSEIAHLLEDFRKRLAIEIAKRLDRSELTIDIPERTRLEDLDLLRLSRAEHEELRRILQPLLLRLAARIGRNRKRRSSGRLDVSRTVRRSLQTGGVPLDVVTRRHHPHRPELVVLCDVSGSVADFAQFTFTMINALHAEVRRVRSFAFVDGIAEVTDVFEEARYDIAVNRLVERRGVVGLDGHSDYGAVFTQFHQRHLDDAVGSGTTLIVTGDARGNYRESGAEQFSRIAARAKRVYWLNPEPEMAWGQEDSLIEEYRRSCTAIKEVRTLGQLADAIAELV